MGFSLARHSIEPDSVEPLSLPPYLTCSTRATAAARFRFRLAAIQVSLLACRGPTISPTPALLGMDLCVLSSVGSNRLFLGYYFIVASVTIS